MLISALELAQQGNLSAACLRIVRQILARCTRIGLAMARACAETGAVSRSWQTCKA